MVYDVCMEVSFYIIVFIFALLVGSFLNVVILRLGSGESFVSGRSHCMGCNGVLKWKDLLPVFSFAFLKGKCRYCKDKISFQYPLVELITGLVFLSVLFYRGIPEGVVDMGYVVLLWCLFSMLIVIAFRDIRQFRVDNELIVLSLIFALALVVYGYINYEVEWVDLMVGSVTVFGFFVLLFIGTKGRGMGMGDVKLSFVVAVFLGVYGYEMLILWLFLAFVFGGIIGVLLMIFKGKRRKDRLPFAPFLISSAFIVFFVGDYLWENYTSILLI